jgi:hypothetical protein
LDRKTDVAPEQRILTLVQMGLWDEHFAWRLSPRICEMTVLAIHVQDVTSIDFASELDSGTASSYCVLQNSET